MPFCHQCGKEVQSGTRICPYCGTLQKSITPNTQENKPDNEQVMSRPEEIKKKTLGSENGKNYNEMVKKAAETMKSGASSISESVQNGISTVSDAVEQARQERFSQIVMLADGEEIIRSYLCARMISPKCDGYLTVTNKRVIFEGKALSSRVVQETWIEGISGINAYYGNDISILKIVAGIVLMIFGFTLPDLGEMFTVKLMLIVFGILLLITAFQKCFRMNVHTGNFNGSGIAFGSSPNNMLGNAALNTLSGRPTEDTDRMINEIGALIKDLQTQGDLAIKKWKKD